MDLYDSGEEEAVWILGQSVEGQENEMHSEVANHDEEEERGEEGSEEQNLRIMEFDTVHQNAPSNTIRPGNSCQLPPV
jgi:hypothetical protein